MYPKNCFLFLTAAFALFSLAAKPVYQWDFNHFSKLTKQQFRGEKLKLGGKQVAFYGAINPRAGVKNSPALACMGRAQFAYLPMDFKDFTLEMTFKLVKLPDTRKHTFLFAYTADKKFSRRLYAWIKPRGRIEFVSEILSGKNKREKHFSFTTPAVKWQTNKFYTLRVSVSSGKSASVMLDGKLLGEKSNALGLSDLKSPAAEEMSVLYFGFNPYQGPRNRPSNLLNGFVDNIRIWNKTPGKTEVAAAAAEAGKESVQSAPHLLFDNQWSTPFIVGELPGELLGTFVRADEKFWKNAARVRAKMDKTNLTVEFDCPVPAGMKPSAASRLWSSATDRVEFFFQPDPKSNRFYQYAAAVDGRTYAGIDAQNNPQSRARFSVKTKKNGYGVIITVPLKELGVTKITPGMAFRGNFMRTGKTAGRHSFWSPCGDTFQSPENFSTLICGSRKAYFLRKFNAVKQDSSAVKQTKAFKKEAEQLEEKIRKHGDDPGKFNQLEAGLRALDYAIAQLRLEGKKQLIWKPEMWENDLAVSRLSLPLKNIRVRLPRNGRTLVGFAVSNLENVSFLGQVKVFKYWPFKNQKRQHFSMQDWDDFLSNITIYEGIAARDESGRLLYDALSPLPLNTLLRIPAKTTAPVWLEISSKGLKPGRYTGFIVLKNCDGSGTFESAKLELTVAETDLDEVHLDQHVYNYLNRRGWYHDSFRKFFKKYDYNYLNFFPGNGLYIYWKKGKGGKLIPGDLKQLGKIVELAVSSGYDIKKLKFFFCLSWNFGLGASPDTKLGKQIIKASLPAWLEYLEKNYGIPHEHVVFNPIDEPNGDIDDPKTSMAKVLRWSKLIKEAAPRAKVMNNPLHASRSNAFQRLAPWTDIFCLHRPETEGNPAFRKYMTSLAKKGKEIWTYHILQKSQNPERYRVDYWRNCRDNFNSVTTFWDLANHAGGDGFDSNDVTNPKGRIRRTDYGMIYVDYNYGTLMIGRRFAAAQMGHQEAKLIAICRKRMGSLRKKGVSVKAFEKQLKAIILKACQGNMNDMDRQAEALLELSEQLVKLDNKQK